MGGVFKLTATWAIGVVLIAAALFHFANTAESCSVFEHPASLAKWKLFERLLTGVPVDIGDQCWHESKINAGVRLCFLDQ
jgi:hypothetical protein